MARLSHGYYFANPACTDFQPGCEVSWNQPLLGRDVRFGKNSPRGVVWVRTNGPTKELSGYLRGGYEFKANQRFLERSIAGPITEMLGFRIAACGDRMRG